MVGLDAGRSREGTATGQLAREEAKGGVCVCVLLTGVQFLMMTKFLV